MSGRKINRGKTRPWLSQFFHSHRTEVILAPNQLAWRLLAQYYGDWGLKGRVGDAPINS